MNMRTICFWTATAIVGAELLAGGVMDLARTSYVVRVVTAIGYPEYILTILGLAKVPGALVLIAPGLARLKEWAYAGAVFEMAGAVLSLVAAGRPATELITPLAFVALTLISWALRPASRGGMLRWPPRGLHGA
jgi:hypothetical protein